MKPWSAATTIQSVPARRISRRTRIDGGEFLCARRLRAVRVRGHVVPASRRDELALGPDFTASRCRRRAPGSVAQPTRSAAAVALIMTESAMSGT
jgi:hypothetical protein